MVCKWPVVRHGGGRHINDRARLCGVCRTAVRSRSIVIIGYRSPFPVSVPWLTLSQMWHHRKHDRLLPHSPPKIRSKNLSPRSRGDRRRSGVCIARILHLPSIYRVHLHRASRKAGGFLAKDWHDGPTASLAALSFNLHDELSKEYGGDKKWGYRRVRAVQVNVSGQRRGNAVPEVDWIGGATSSQ